MTGHLDINTPNGQAALVQERRLIQSAVAVMPDVCVAETKKKLPASVDGVLFSKGEIVGVYESKVRALTLDQLRTQFNDEWLVTYEKICEGAQAARLLRVPYFGFLYLTLDNVGLGLRIADEAGQFLPRIRLERTVTQRTCNGGKALRTNAYIDVSRAQPFSINVAA